MTVFNNMLLSAWASLSVEVHVYLICDTMILKIYICVRIIIIGKYIEAQFSLCYLHLFISLCVQLAMSSSVDISTQNDEILTFENIIATLSTLLTRLSQFKDSVPQSSSSNNTTYNNSGSNDLNNDNTTITAATTDNNSGSSYLNNGHSFNEECLVTHRQFDKLQRDLNQIKEAFRRLKNFEHDAGVPIKNLECCLDDISKIVSEASNDAFPNKEVQAKLSAIKKDALKLKLNFPSLRPKMSTKDSVHRRPRPTNGSNSVVNEFPSLHMNHKFVCSSVFTFH